LIREKCMLRMTEQLAKQLANPSEFFNSVRIENWKPGFVFFLHASRVIAEQKELIDFWKTQKKYFDYSL